MEKDIINTIRYFAQFGYPPNFDEVYTFFPKKISRKNLRSLLYALIKKETIIAHTPPSSISQTDWYTVPECRDHFQNRIKRYSYSVHKRKIIQKYIKTLSYLPSIQMVGISGSVAMMNARKNDDVDLFIITREDCLWTGRLSAILVAELYGMRRRRTDWINVKNKICLNLFFDRKNVVIPRYKRSNYVAHEILQFLPVVNKNQTYELFLQKNAWVFDIFPNATSDVDFLDQIKYKTDINRQTAIIREASQYLSILESLTRAFQIGRIKEHQTNEIITETQLWFFPDDYEEQVEKY